MKRPFWIVWSPNGPYPPRVTHRSEEEARTAATQMARQNKGSRFFWLRADGSAVSNDVQIEQYGDGTDDDSDIPF